MTKKSLWYVLPLALLFIQCQDDDNNDLLINDDVVEIPVEDIDTDLILIRPLNLPATPFNYANLPLPNYLINGPGLGGLDNTPNNNPVTDAGATLGRVLFYDVNLSANNSTSCASCHQQDRGFSDPDRLSTGFEGGLTGRHSMGLSNARWYDNGRFFWDERAASLEDQVLMPIQDHVEMGMNLEALLIKLNQIDYYEELFVDAFGDATITEDRIARAMAQFVRSIVSYQTKFDEGVQMVNGQNIADANFPNFTTLENLGKDLFFSGRTQCANCHESVHFVGDQARNNGLDAETEDPGVAGITGNNNDAGEFKVGSLRNIALAAPYMHDGRFATLEEVIEHYNSGVQDHPNLDNRLRVGGNQIRRLNLSNQEKQALVDFLETLTDPAMSSDPKYSDPFEGQ